VFSIGYVYCLLALVSVDSFYSTTAYTLVFFFKTNDNVKFKDSDFDEIVRIPVSALCDVTEIELTLLCSMMSRYKNKPGKEV
jgi:citrate lyase synthetase